MKETETTRPGHWIALIVLAGWVMSCGGTGEGSNPDVPAEGVRIESESPRADQLLAFYFGSYLGPDGRDPVEAGLLEKREKSWFLRNPQSVSEAHPALSGLYDQFLASGWLPADSLEAFVEDTYYAARSFPLTLDLLMERAGPWSEPAWFAVEVEGSMVALPRRTWVRRDAIQAALDGMESPSDPIRYPEGTLFVGEHLDQGRVVETSVMQKRADGFWDYWAYDTTGRLVDRVRKEPRDLIVPTRCTGCHYGDRAFEPERSFPAEARPGPAGPRTIHVPSSWRNPEIVTLLDEHMRRSDTVLGLYATLYLAEAAAGQGDAAAEAVLSRFGITQRTP
jgi:hypothetical protein